MANPRALEACPECGMTKLRALSCRLCDLFARVAR